MAPELAADLAGVAELAAALNATRQQVCNWAVRYDDFPAPVRVLACGPIYRRSEVVTWHQARAGRVVAP